MPPHVYGYPEINSTGSINEYYRSSSMQKPKNDLTDRATKAFRDNPGLTYDKIYKDMKVDMNSEDTDVYKQAEDEWLKKHGY